MNMNNIDNGNSNNIVPGEVVNSSDNNDIDFSSVTPLGEPQNSNNNDEKKKVIIIIGVVIFLILVIVLIVISNKDDNAKDHKNNDSSNSYKENQDSYLDEVKRIYLYKVIRNDYTSYTASFSKLDKVDDTKYEEIYKYECNDSCVYSVESDYENELAILYILDDKKIYQYDSKDKDLKEMSFDREVKLKEVTFKISDEYLVAYNSEYLSIDKDIIKLYNYKQVEVNGIKTTETLEYYATRESLKDNIYAVSSDFTEYVLYKIYNEDNKLAEIKENGSSYIRELKYDGKYIVLINSLNNLIVSKSGKVQKTAKDDQYAIYNDKLIVSNESGNIEVYSEDNLLSMIEAKQSKVSEKGYVVIIKDDKLELYDAISNKLVGDLGAIKTGEILGNYKYTNPVSYSDFSGEDIITVFLEDTSKSKDGNKVFGRTIRYNVTQNKIMKDEEDYKIISE